MFTLHVPILLPVEYSYFDNGQYPVPPLPGNLIVSSVEHKDAPLFLSVAGFSTENDARQFYCTLRSCLRWATLHGEHSMTIHASHAVTAPDKLFDGSVPTVFPTGSARPYHMTSSSQNGLHISLLSNRIGEAIAKGVPTKLQAQPELALALELFAEFQFAGTLHSQFVMLFTALEVIETAATKKRGATIRRVKDALAMAGHPDPKSVAKRLDKLYEDRNALIHEGQPITDMQLSELKEIVRNTLKALLA